MSKKKKKKKSYDEYRDIPKDYNQRMEYLYEKLKIKQKDIDKMNEMRILIQNKKNNFGKIKLIVYTIPEGIGRPRTTRFGRMYVPNIQKFYKIMKKYVSKHPYTSAHYSCHIKLKFYLPTPKAMSRYEKILAEEGLIDNLSKPDWDNLGKSTDMFNNVIWDDDSLVTKAKVQKYYSAKPRIEAVIKYYLEPDCKYTERLIKNRHGGNLNARRVIKIKRL